ncbi:MAG: hypothetical protein WA964_06980 [Ilumatobacter sp.]|uniref:hypothetical protein n=1 Tax=Ilumatobacter sp. TaxID=1967498 RepID=UPI003C73B51D
MSEEIQEMQRQIVSAVQQELTRFSGEVASNLKTLSDDVAAEAAARSDLERQVQALAGALESGQGSSTQSHNDLQQVLEARLNEFSAATKRRHDEMNNRLGRVADEANVGISAAVEAAARPIIAQVEFRQDTLESEVRTLDGSLRKFDEQAGQMVEHINQVTSAIDGRLERVQADALGSLDERIEPIVLRIDDVSAAAARQQAEVSNLIGDRVDSSEVRINERMLGLENRMNEEIGQRVADIDAHVGRIGVGLDDAVIMLNDRIAKADQKFTDVETTITGLREQMENVDEEAIDEMKEKISSALGQAELVRIEMERFQETITSSLDKTAVRLTEIETTVQDQAMDVETAVQLERLEEVERAVLMLDPDIIRSREDDDQGDATVAMTRPADDDAAAASVQRTTPVVPMDDRLESPPASAPLTPPTAEPTNNSEPATPAAPSVDLSMSLEPPVNF